MSLAIRIFTVNKFIGDLNNSLVVDDGQNRAWCGSVFTTYFMSEGNDNGKGNEKIFLNNESLASH